MKQCLISALIANVVILHHRIKALLSAVHFVMNHRIEARIKSLKKLQQ
ncbi:hypothetical protein FM109_00180 [Vibrio casei]|nr:hypothetical protein FM109_00180 [Vibrio casei]